MEANVERHMVFEPSICSFFFFFWCYIGVRRRQHEHSTAGNIFHVFVMQEMLGHESYVIIII